MILSESYSVEWIYNIQKEYKSDPILTEKFILALTLLEQLKISGLDFIFKGGTALILLLGEPKRLSIDIDIIINSQNKDVLDDLFKKIIAISVFIEYEKNERITSKEIPKEHYKFYYLSSISKKREYVLLDLLFEENTYSNIINTCIESKFLKCSSEKTNIKTPTISCILGDKLTAYAPNTTGIKYGVGKELEIIKQLFDVANLFDLADNINDIKSTFNKLAEKEIGYRGIQSDSNAVLMDVFETSSIITYRGKRDSAHYNELQAGILKIKPYILTSSFALDKAIQCASKAAYLSMVLLKNIGSIEKYTGNEDFGKLNIGNFEFSKFNKLKKTDLQAFYYWYKAIELYDKS